MSKVHYICILGKARTGKTTVANLIVKFLRSAGMTAEVNNLADTLKALCPQMPGETKEQWRPRLLEIGNFNRGRYGNGYLATKIIMRTDDFRDDIEGGFIVVPDVRIEDEYDNFATARNALSPTLFIRLSCTDGTWAKRFASEEEYLTYMTKASGDITETGLPDVEAEDVTNNSDGAGKKQILKMVFDRYLKAEEAKKDAAQ